MDVSENQPNCGILKPNDLLVAHDAVQAFSHGNDMMYMCICTFQHVASSESDINQTKPNHVMFLCEKHHCISCFVRLCSTCCSRWASGFSIP